MPTESPHPRIYPRELEPQGWLWGAPDAGGAVHPLLDTTQKAGLSGAWNGDCIVVTWAVVQDVSVRRDSFYRS